MRYILDDLGYIEAVSSHLIECKNKSCTEYTGAIPEGYETLDDWVLNANIRAYKLDGKGNLTFDADRYAALQEEYNTKLLPNEFLLYENSSGSNGTITLSDSVANYNVVKIYYKDQYNNSPFQSVEIEKPNGKTAQLQIVGKDGTTQKMRITTTQITINDDTLTPSNSAIGYTSVNTWYDANEILIMKVVGYR